MVISRTPHKRAAALLSFVSLTISLVGCDVVLGIPDVEFADGVDPGQTTPWWNADFLYRTHVEVNVPALQEPLQDVPILLAFDETKTPFMSYTLEGGLRVVDADNNPLNHEPEAFAPDGKSYLWVRVPTMESEETITLWLYHGGPPGGPQPDKTDVWRNDYLAVWHLNDNTINESVLGFHVDATGNGHVGGQNRNGYGTTAEGAIGGSQEFDGANDYIDVEADNDLDTGHPAMTILARAYVRRNGTLASSQLVGAGGTNNPGHYRQLFWDPSNSSWAARYWANGQAPLVLSQSGGYDEWAVVASVYNGSEVRVYHNGVERGTQPLSGFLSPIDSFFIGGNPALESEDGVEHDFDGYLDEVRVSTTARSSDWMLVQYQSMSDQLVTFRNTGCLGMCPPPR